MSISSEITRLQNAKAGIKSAIEAKGVTVGDGTIDTYPAKINEIQTGGGSLDDYFNNSIHNATSDTVECGNWLHYIKKLPSNIQLSEYTHNCTNMFCGYPFASLILTNFNTLNVTNMNSMFKKCFSLTNLDLSSFNTSNVTDMKSMFYQCASLTSLNLSNFNTSNVTNMNYMFYNSNKLTSLDLSSFNTSNVTSMNGMFSYCSSLTSLDLSSFNTVNVTSMDSMFYNCSSLKNINISNFDFTNITSHAGMFTNVPNDCYILVKDATAKEWITTNFTNLTNVHYVGEEG